MTISVYYSANSRIIQNIRHDCAADKTNVYINKSCPSLIKSYIVRLTGCIKCRISLWLYAVEYLVYDFGVVECMCMRLIIAAILDASDATYVIEIRRNLWTEVERIIYNKLCMSAMNVGSEELYWCDSRTNPTREKYITENGVLCY